MNNGNGPTTINIPAQTKTVCRGCSFLYIEAGLRSRFEHKDTYSCTHPSNETFSSSVFGRGRTIQYMATNCPEVPDWCPLKKNNQ